LVVVADFAPPLFDSIRQLYERRQEIGRGGNEERIRGIL
jgi:hypothetical protein